MNVAVSPENRGQGIATELIRRFLAKLDGVRHVYLEVRVSNIPAQKLYAGLGFLPVGVRRSYYRLPEENAIIMRLDLPD